MFKLKRAILAIAFLSLLIVPAHATRTVSAIGAPDSGGLYPIIVDDDDMITINGGLYEKYETSITNDTLTTAESGTTYFVTVPSTKQITYTLPTVTAGVRYRFVATTGDSNITASQYFQLDPASPDFFVGGVNSSAGNTFVAGDRIRSGHVTGDSIEVTGDDHSHWVVTEMRGTFTDAN